MLCGVVSHRHSRYLSRVGSGRGEMVITSGDVAKQGLPNLTSGGEIKQVVGGCKQPDRREMW